MTNSANQYRKKRIEHWDRVSSRKKDPKRIGAFYHTMLHQYYRFLVPEGLRVLELGCGHGDLLAALDPSFGLGVDFSSSMIHEAKERHPHLHLLRADVHEIDLKDTFDVIILSDIANDLWDAQTVFENVRRLCHSRTRVIVNFYNNLWKLPLSLIKRLGLGFDLLEQNWFDPHDLKNLLYLSGFDVISMRSRILFPLQLFLLSSLMNRYLVNLPILKWFALTNVIVARPNARENHPPDNQRNTVSVIVAARNEAGNIESIFNRVSLTGLKAELIFVEGGSTDHTYECIQETMERFPEQECRLYRQAGKGKGDAVRLGFDMAKGDILMILDADLTVPPEDLPRFVDAIRTGKGEFINGVRLVYPMEDQAMRFFNMVGNKFFSLAFSWLLEQPVKDTLCGTKVLRKKDYERLKENRHYFGDFDPFGDFDLLFGASKMNLKIVDLPVRYHSRQYGDTNISRWRHGWMLIKMVIFAARRIKFI